MTTEDLSTSAIAEQLRHYLAVEELTDSGSVDVETPLAEMGVDSSRLLALLSFVERRFKVMVPDAELNQTTLASLRAVAACVHRLATSRVDGLSTPGPHAIPTSGE